MLFSLRIGSPVKRKGRREYHLLYDGAERLARTLNLDPLYDVLENHLLLAVAYRAESEHLFVHAGVVGWKGQAIVIPGRSLSGKSTLVHELGKVGATYYSDEMAVFDKQGRVHPYPAPLSVRQGGCKSKLDPRTIGEAVGAEPLPVGLVLVTEFRSGAKWRPRMLTPGRALMALFGNTVAARRVPGHALDVLLRVAEGALAIKSSRGEARDVAPFLPEVIENRRANNSAGSE